jgi:hypothetical protein
VACERLRPGNRFQPEILPWLILRPKAFAGERPGRARGGRREQLLAELDGATCAAQLALRLGWDLDELGTVARDVCDQGLATHQLEVPAAAPLPLHDLLRRTVAIPGAAAGGHLGLISRFLELMDAYGPAGAARRDALGEEALGLVGGVLGVTRPARKDRFYADHLPLREECAGDMALRVGGRRARELREWTAPGLELLAGTAARVQVTGRQRVAHLLGAGSTPLWQVAVRLRGEASPRDTALQQRLADWEVSGPGEMDLRMLDLEGLGCPDGEPILGSVDLMVRAASLRAWAAGDYELVLGDIHDTVLLWGWPLQFHPERERVEAETAAALAALRPRLPLVTIISSRRTGLPPIELPGPVAELGGVSASAQPWRVPFDDLVVESDGRDARLLSRGLGSEVRLTNGELEGLVQVAFALPQLRGPALDLGPRTPRIRLGPLVMQRERWKLTGEDVAQLTAARGDLERLRAACRVWERRGIPERVFAKAAGERKPVLIDLSSPLLLRLLGRLLARGEDVSLTEMLPGPDELWLVGPDGRHTAELRCIFLHG